MSKIICIGRQYGSGGREIGEKLARTLQIPCYDKLLIKKAAFESGMSEEFISKTEESPINSIQFFPELNSLELSTVIKCITFQNLHTVRQAYTLNIAPG